jgi:hypothetical protein
MQHGKGILVDGRSRSPVSSGLEEVTGCRLPGQIGGVDSADNFVADQCACQFSLCRQVLQADKHFNLSSRNLLLFRQFEFSGLL